MNQRFIGFDKFTKFVVTFAKDLGIRHLVLDATLGVGRVIGLSGSFNNCDESQINKQHLIV